MDLELSIEQQELADMAKGLLDHHAPLSLARSYIEGNGDAIELRGALKETGWYSVGMDDDFGVSGLCLLAAECGAHVAPTPLVDTAVAARLAAVADTDALAPVSAGERAVGLAAIEPSFDWSLAGLATSAASRHGGWVLNGVKVGVRHAADVDAIAVVALLDDEVGVFFVSPRGVGVEIAAPTGVDATCAGATVTLVEAPVEPGAAVTRMDRAAIQRHLCVGAVATAAEAVGAASKLLDLAVEYSLNREQFGRAIGRFQAVQHLLADAHVLRETAWSTTLYAAGTLDEGVPDPLEVIAIAKAHASRAARTIGELALQVFGGVAFTWEHDAHLFQRRILDCERRFGDSFHHERVVAERLLCGSSSLVS